MSYQDYFNGAGFGLGGINWVSNSWVYQGVPIDIGTASLKIIVFADGIKQSIEQGHFTRVGNTIDSPGWRVASGPPDNIPATIVSVVAL